MFGAEVTKDDIHCIRIDKGYVIYGSLCYTHRVKTIEDLHAVLYFMLGEVLY